MNEPTPVSGTADAWSNALLAVRQANAAASARRTKGPWGVVLTNHDRYSVSAAWGPFYDWDEASQFCQYVTQEIDPAFVVTLMSPAGELLGWRRTIGMPAVQAVYEREEADRNGREQASPAAGQAGDDGRGEGQPAAGS